MDPERLRAELKRLVDELPHERQGVWRGTVDEICSQYASLRTELDACRTAADLADAVRESTATMAISNEVMRSCQAELSNRIPIPDAATAAKLGGVVAAVLGPIVAAAFGIQQSGLIGGTP